MSKGGFRPLAGRKKKGGRPPGSKDSVKRLPRRGTTTSEQALDARQRARVWLTENESPVLAALMDSGDNRVVLEVYKLMKKYGDGEPAQRLEISSRKSPEQILEEIALRRGSIDVEARAVEVLSPARAPVIAQIAAPEAVPALQEPAVGATVAEAVPASPPTDFEVWLASPEGRCASPQLIEANRRILSVRPFEGPTEDGEDEWL